MQFEQLSRFITSTQSTCRINSRTIEVMAELKISDLSIPASALLRDENPHDQFPIWRETVQTLVEFRDVYHDFIALEENPMHAEVLEEIQSSMNETRDSLTRDPTNEVKKAKLASLTAKYKEAKSSVETETPEARAKVAKQNVMAKVILQKSTTIKAYLKYSKSAWSLWRKIISDHQVQAAAYVEDIKRDLEYLVLNNNVCQAVAGPR